MRLARLLDALRSRLGWLIKLSLLVLALLVVADLVPGLIDKHHAHTKAEQVPGFWALFGFLGCVLIFVLSKSYGHLGISTREDYYDE